MRTKSIRTAKACVQVRIFPKALMGGIEVNHANVFNLLFR